jgi:hypothetical protein
MTEKEINRIEYSTRKIKRFYALFIVEPTAKIAPGLRFCGARHCAGLNRRTPPQRCVIRQCRLRCATIHLILTFDNQTLPAAALLESRGKRGSEGPVIKRPSEGGL